MHPPLAQVALTLRHVASLAQPRRSARPTLSRAMPRAPALAAARTAAPYAVSWRFPWPCHACLAIQPSGQAVLSQYNLLYRDTLPQQQGQALAGGPLTLARGPAVSWPISAVSWSCPRPYRGPCYLSMRACCVPYVTIQCTAS